MRVAFVFNGFALRGVELNMYWYAHFNEALLNNTSIIVCKRGMRGACPEDSPDSARRFFADRFPELHELQPAEIDQRLLDLRVDVCMVGVAGGPDSLVPSSVPTISHCVFDAGFPLGTLHTAISNTVSRGRVAVLPNIVHLPPAEGDFRDFLGIPRAAIVFGRYGGWDSFDVPYAADTVLRAARDRPDIHFVFMNTQPFGPPVPNITFVKGTPDLATKRRFVNTCHAMLHARQSGETFGMACGEFAIAGKPVVTNATGDGEHRRILGQQAIVYSDAAELYSLLVRPEQRVLTMDMAGTRFHAYRPERVMATFRAAIAQCLLLWWQATGAATRVETVYSE